MIRDLWERIQRYKQREQERESGFEDEPIHERCRHPQHEPPAHMVIPYGKIYRHVCPGCGRTIRIRSSNVSW